MKKIYFLMVPVLFLLLGYPAICQDPSVSGDIKAGQFAAGWQLISSGVEENLLSVHFASSTHGFIGGSFSRCLKSTNGGLNWSASGVPSYADFNSVWVHSSSDVCLGGWDSVYSTHNGGQSWQGAYTQTVNYAIFDLQFTSPDEGFAFMTWSQFAKTTDGGNSWSLATGGGFTAWDFFGGFMLDQNTGYAVGDNQVLCKTTDGGESFSVYEWNNYSDFTGIRLWGVSAPSDLVAVVVADSGVIFRTTDGGSYWSRSTIAGPEDNLMDVYFINSSLGYIVGSNGLVFKTMDGGESWAQEPQITTHQLNAVFFISDKLGWAVGDNGTILRFEGTNNLQKDDAPSDTRGMQISPNPLSCKSILSFNLPRKQHVRVEVCDLAGRTLNKVLDGSLESGNHFFMLQLPDLAAGTYYCRLSSTGLNLSEPFIISR